MSSSTSHSVIAPPAPNASNGPLVSPPRFAIAFGLTGLANAWDAAARHLGGSPVVGSVLAIVATAVLLGLVIVYIVERLRTPGGFAADFRSPVLFPFLSLPIVSAELLISRLAMPAPILTAVAFLALLSLGIVLAIVHLGRLLTGGIGAQHLHGGQLLPSVAGTIVPAVVLARLGFGVPAAAFLGTGLALALLFTALLGVAAIGGTPVAPALRPTLAILIAPPALGGTVALELHSDAEVIAAFAGVTALAVVMQLGLIPAYRRGGFSPAFWSFSFPAAAAVGFGIAATSGVPAVAIAVCGWASLGVLTAGVAALGWATVRALVSERRASLAQTP